MKNISLTQVTSFVAAVCLASSFVNADDALTQSAEENAMITSESYISDNNSVNAQPLEVNADIDEVQNEEASGDRFTFTSLDTDQNGKLNQQEVIAGKNQWLVKAFNDIDNNADDLLTEQELVDFAIQIAAIDTIQE